MHQMTCLGSADIGGGVSHYPGIYEDTRPQMMHRVDWTDEAMKGVDVDPRKVLPEDPLVDRQIWRGRRLMALAARKRQADEEIERQGRICATDQQCKHTAGPTR